MKNTVNNTLKFVFIIIIGILICLTISFISIGFNKTKIAIKALLNRDNYSFSYKLIEPRKQHTNHDNESNNNSTKVLGVFKSRNIIDKTSNPSLIIPSSGIAPRAQFLYTGPLKEGKHEGIDIWTNYKGSGIDTNSYGKGNPVYSACDGYVRNIWEENGDVSIICDPIDPLYKDVLPSLKVKTLYGHMADQFSNEVYIYVKEGQEVKQGELIGHQGNRCYWSPRNIIVHLHFAVYDIRTAPQIPLDPSPYIGVSCTTLNQKFTAQEK